MCMRGKDLQLGFRTDPNKEAIEGEKPKPSPRFMQHEAQNEARAISINKQIRAATRPPHIVP